MFSIRRITNLTDEKCWELRIIFIEVKVVMVCLSLNQRWKSDHSKKRKCLPLGREKTILPRIQGSQTASSLQNWSLSLSKSPKTQTSVSSQSSVHISLKIESLSKDKSLGRTKRSVSGFKKSYVTQFGKSMSKSKIASAFESPPNMYPRDKRYDGDLIEENK